MSKAQKQEEARALVLISVDTGHESPKVAKKIIDLRIGTEMVTELSGRNDIMCLLRRKSIAELNTTLDKLRVIPGITSVETNIFLNIPQDWNRQKPKS